MTTEFNLFGLRDELLQAIEERGYETPTDIQAQIIPLMLEANDVQAQSQTGTGKTAAFSLPILNVMEHKQQVQCLVRDQELRAFSEEGGVRFEVPWITDHEVVVIS